MLNTLPFIFRSKKMASVFYYFSCILFLCMSSLCGAVLEDRKVYIVYMGSLPEGDYSPSTHHLSVLQKVVDGSVPTKFLVRSYQRSFNGFAAMLTGQEAQKLAGLKEIASVFPSTTYQLHTTRSWDFMGFRESRIKRQPSGESNIIVGVIDTGIWPESKSFSDKGFGPAPKKWKGVCHGGANFACNNKIIGARYYKSSDDSIKDARDYNGHGTHTSSTAAGNKVKGASFYGLAQGTARGGVPSARIAVYKACGDDCQAEAILAAFDDAIADGVDIINISLGSNEASPIEKDCIAIGSFHAMEKGILPLQSAGNLGFLSSSQVVSVAPWLFTVAASTIDRDFVDKVVLGNRRTLVGSSINAFKLNGTRFPLVYGKAASNQCDDESAQLCTDGCLNKVKGKIVLCGSSYGTTVAQTAGAVGSIVLNDFSNDTAYIFSSPTSALRNDDYNTVVSYVNSTKKPVATILRSEMIRDSSAPIVASFSLPGPNPIVKDILKPDVTAPGVDILAAYSPVVSPSDETSDTRRVQYSLLSGTSMSCPHVAGATAYVKSFHPDWSPSVIKSAIMTTAWRMNPTKNLHREFAYGSGHINPVRAIHPGLVYEVYKEDYIKLLCGLGYTTKFLRKITGDNSTCNPDSHKLLAVDLNYPSMTVHVTPAKYFNVTFHRMVTNVGLGNTTYKAKIFPSSKIDVKVVPKVLSFKSSHEKKNFLVNVVGKGLKAGEMVSTSLVWFDGIHTVRSPIVVYTPSPDE